MREENKLGSCNIDVVMKLLIKNQLREGGAAEGNWFCRGASMEEPV